MERDAETKRHGDEGDVTPVDDSSRRLRQLGEGRRHRGKGRRRPTRSLSSISHESADLNNNKVENNGGEITGSDVRGGEGVMNWQSARLKSEILAHPLYEQLLSAHVACLRIATPVDQLPRIDAQLAQSQHVVGKYSGLGHGSIGDDKELDQFMALAWLLALVILLLVEMALD
ncbi:unnamed protein product [Camellia sinensis]